MLNLRTGVIQKNNEEDLTKKLKDENPKRLTPLVIRELERLVPLKKGKIFDRIGWDGIESRKELLDLAFHKEISLKVCQMEVRRRKKMKVV